MAGHLSGKGGFVYWSASAAMVAGIKSWTLDRTVDMLDTTDFGSSGDKEYIAGLRGWSGTFEGLKDGVPLGLGTVASLCLYEASTANAGVWIGQAYLNNLTVNTAVDGLVTYSYQYMGTGALTIAAS